MTHLPLDKKAMGLLHRVRDDLFHLRDDVNDLWSHTTRKALPKAARDLGDLASARLAAGGEMAADRLRQSISRYAAPRHPHSGWISGALVVGLLAAGAYALVRKQPAHGMEGHGNGGGGLQQSPG
jgi:hypothetical protein